MRTPRQHAELIVGRPLNKVEKQLLDLFGEDKRYKISKDENGNLRATRIKKVKEIG